MEGDRPLVLIVDDEPWNLEVLESFMHDTGYGIIRAENGKDALKAAVERPPDLVLLDVMMPEMDGFEVCRRLKADERTRFVPVVIVTSLDQMADKIAAIESGADDFITKPVDKTELLARSASLLRLKKYHDERDKAYADIRNITLFFSDAVGKFDPLNFSLDASYDLMFSVILRGPAGEKDKPTHALVIPDINAGFSNGTLYTVKDGSVVKKPVHFTDPGIVAETFGYKGRRDLHVNHPPQAFLTPSVLREAGPISNFTSCYTDAMLVACFNYGRQVGSYDVQVIKDLAMHSMFFDTLAGQVKENEDALLYTIKALARAAEVNDEDTGNHINRVNEYSHEVARALGLSEKLSEEIRYSAQMHDVGKLHTPSEILKKPGKLTAEEYEEVKRHPLYAVKILGDSPRLKVAREIAMSHHERWDGSGYPNGLKGEEIPLPARIVSICDIYDALRNKRAYKPAFDHETAYKIITEGDGRTLPQHFDPQVLDAFKKVASRFEEIYLEFKDASE